MFYYTYAVTDSPIYDFRVADSKPVSDDMWYEQVVGWNLSSRCADCVCCVVSSFHIRLTLSVSWPIKSPEAGWSTGKLQPKLSLDLPRPQVALCLCLDPWSHPAAGWYSSKVQPRFVSRLTQTTGSLSLCLDPWSHPAVGWYSSKVQPRFVSRLTQTTGSPLSVSWPMKSPGSRLIFK